MEAFLSQAWREKSLVLLMVDAVPQTERRIHDVSETWWAREDSNLQPDRYERTCEARAESDFLSILREFCLCLTRFGQ